MIDPYVCPDCGRDKALTTKDARDSAKCQKWKDGFNERKSVECFNHKGGALLHWDETAPSREYVNMLKGEIEALRRQLERKYPKDIMDAARATVSQALADIGDHKNSEAVSSGRRDHWSEVQCCAAAIVAERTRLMAGGQDA